MSAGVYGFAAPFSLPAVSAMIAGAHRERLRALSLRERYRRAVSASYCFPIVKRDNIAYTKLLARG